MSQHSYLQLTQINLYRVTKNFTVVIFIESRFMSHSPHLHKESTGTCFSYCSSKIPGVSLSSSVSLLAPCSSLSSPYCNPANGSSMYRRNWIDIIQTTSSELLRDSSGLEASLLERLNS